MAGTLFRLTYGPVHGLALPIRLSAVLNGIEWEDCLIKRDEFARMKQSGEFVPRWTGLPQATFYDQSQPVNVGQSSALLRYVAQLRDNSTNYDLYPTRNTFNCLLIDEIIDSLQDVYKIMTPSFMEQDVEKKLAMRTELTQNPDKLPLFLRRYEQLIADNDIIRGHKNGYFVGDGLSIADLKIFSMTSLLHPRTKPLHSITIDGIDESFLSAYPRVSDHTEMLADHKTIRGFMERFNEITNVFNQKQHEQELVMKYPLLEKTSKVFLKSYKTT
eukprot:201126_1